MDFPSQSGQNRLSVYHRLLPGIHGQSTQRFSHSLQHKPSIVTTVDSVPESRSLTPTHSSFIAPQNQSQSATSSTQLPASSSGRRISYANPPVIQTQGLTPLMETVDHAIKDTGLQPTSLPANMTTDDFTRAVAVATVSALRHQQHHSRSPARVRISATELEAAAGGHGGHDAPSWSRTTSASVLLACTALYAIIAGTHSHSVDGDAALTRSLELLVDVVDVVLDGSGIDEKFLGVTLFALVPNTTEFMNAISFALNNNIALRFVRGIGWRGMHTNCGSFAVWKLDRPMLYKSACCRFLPWLRSPPGMRRRRWVR